MLYRNSRVYDIRIWFIDNYYQYHDLLPTYSRMMYAFKPVSKEYWIGYVVLKANEKHGKENEGGKTPDPQTSR